MVFTDKKYFNVISDNFLSKQYIGYTSAGSLNTAAGITPGEGCAIDKSKSIALIKAHEESLERKKIAIQMDKNEKVQVLNYIDKSIYEVPSKYYGYGFNETYGYVDTTGTISGVKSTNAIEGAILELIEKNEMLLLWYKFLGFYIKKESSLEELIRNMNFSSERVEIFFSKNLSNMPVFFVILISDDKLIASGAGIHRNSELALEKAMNEARLLEWQNKNNNQSTLTLLSEIDQDKIIKHINLMRDQMEKISFEKFIEETLLLPGWLSSLEFHVLNSITDTGSLTIKCLSQNILNCLPKKEYIFLKEKELHKQYSITKESITEIPDCFLL